MLSRGSRDRSPFRAALDSFTSAPLTALAATLVTACLYAAAAKAGLSMASLAEQVSVVWPPTGIALALLLLFGPVVIPGIVLGAFAANITANEPLGTATVIAVGNTLEAVAGGMDARPRGLRAHVRAHARRSRARRVRGGREHDDQRNRGRGEPCAPAACSRGRRSRCSGRSGGSAMRWAT
jgi:ABC-type Fe3+ transport system permease subunit